MSLCVDICRWYRPGGEFTPEELGDINADLVLRILHAPPTDEYGNLPDYDEIPRIVRCVDGLGVNPPRFVLDTAWGVRARGMERIMDMEQCDIVQGPFVDRNARQGRTLAIKSRGVPITIRPDGGSDG